MTSGRRARAEPIDTAIGAPVTRRRALLVMGAGVLALGGGLAFILEGCSAGGLPTPVWVTLDVDPATLPVGEPVDVAFTATSESYTVTARAWVVRTDGGATTVYDPRCTHASCRYEWKPDAREFECVCHDAAFALDGSVLHGPPPRPLRQLEPPGSGVARARGFEMPAERCPQLGAPRARVEPPDAARPGDTGPGGAVSRARPCIHLLSLGGWVRRARKATMEAGRPADRVRLRLERGPTACSGSRPWPRCPSRQLNRLIRRLGLILLVGLVAFIGFYVFDRWRMPAPPMAEREVVRLEDAVEARPTTSRSAASSPTLYLAAERYDDGIAQYTRDHQHRQLDELGHFGPRPCVRAQGRSGRGRCRLRRVVDIAKGGEMAHVDPMLRRGLLRAGRDRPAAGQGGRGDRAAEPGDRDQALGRRRHQPPGRGVRQERRAARGHRAAQASRSLSSRGLDRPVPDARRRLQRHRPTPTSRLGVRDGRPGVPAPARRRRRRHRHLEALADGPPRSMPDRPRAPLPRPAATARPRHLVPRALHLDSQNNAAAASASEPGRAAVGRRHPRRPAVAGQRRREPDLMTASPARSPPPRPASTTSRRREPAGPAGELEEEPPESDAGGRRSCCCSCCSRWLLLLALAIWYLLFRQPIPVPTIPGETSCPAT